MPITTTYLDTVAAAEPATIPTAGDGPFLHDLDPDGWCLAHGWDCAEYLHHMLDWLADETSEEALL